MGALVVEKCVQVEEWREGRRGGRGGAEGREGSGGDGEEGHLLKLYFNADVDCTELSRLCGGEPLMEDEHGPPEPANAARM